MHIYSRIGLLVILFGLMLRTVAAGDVNPVFVEVASWVLFFSGGTALLAPWEIVEANQAIRDLAEIIRYDRERRHGRGE